MAKLGTRLLAFAVLAAAPLAGAQAATAISYASCVEAGSGCSQVDFFFTLLDGTPADIDQVQIQITTPEWTFSPLQSGEAEDANDLTFFIGDSPDGKNVDAMFPFPAVLDPTLRMRLEFIEFGSSAATLSYSYRGLYQGAEVFAGSVGAAVPEPATWAMMIVGFGALGYSLRRGKTRTNAHAAP